MNQAEYKLILDEIENELAATDGTFQQMFGKKTEKEMKEARYIAAVALVAADRLYSNITKDEFCSRKNS